MKAITETNVNFREVMIIQLKQEYKAHRLKNEKQIIRPEDVGTLEKISRFSELSRMEK